MHFLFLSLGGSISNSDDNSIESYNTSSFRLIQESVSKSGDDVPSSYNFDDDTLITVPLFVFEISSEPFDR